jgi:hypothetical protein
MGWTSGFNDFAMPKQRHAEIGFSEQTTQSSTTANLPKHSKV